VKLQNKLIIILLIVVILVPSSYGLQLYTGPVASITTIAPTSFPTQEYVEFLANNMFGDYCDNIYAFNKTTLEEYKTLLSSPEVHYVYLSGHGGMILSMLPDGDPPSGGTTPDIFVYGTDVKECIKNRQPIKMAFIISCNGFSYYLDESIWEPNSVPVPDKFEGKILEEEFRKGKLENTATFGFRDLPGAESSIAHSVMGKIITFIFEDGMTTGEAFYEAVDMYPDFCHGHLRMAGDTDLKASDLIPEYSGDSNDTDDDDDDDDMPGFTMVPLLIAFTILIIMIGDRRK